MFDGVITNSSDREGTACENWEKKRKRKTLPPDLSVSAGQKYFIIISTGFF